MPDAPWQVLVVDDEADICDQIYRRFNNVTLNNSEHSLEVQAIRRFDDAMAILETSKIDIVILDVRNNEGNQGEDAEAGIRTLAQIKARRFVPVIFYTALPQSVDDLSSPVIRVVEKTAGLTAIETAIREILDSEIPAANRAILRHVEHVQRDFMWELPEILAPHRPSGDKLSIAYLMARRLAASLETSRVAQLAKELGADGEVSFDSSQAHPMFFYIIPPMKGAIHTGGLYRDDQGLFWVVLTNGCDLELRPDKKNPGEFCRKADHILIAGCRPLTGEPEYTDWMESPESNQASRNLDELMRNNRRGGQAERYYFLPAALGLPDLILDVQHLKAVSADQIEAMTCLAGIDSPYVESIITRFTRFYARIGTPDLDISVVRKRLDEAARMDDDQKAE